VRALQIVENHQLAAAYGLGTTDQAVRYGELAQEALPFVRQAGGGQQVQLLALAIQQQNADAHLRVDPFQAVGNPGEDIGQWLVAIERIQHGIARLLQGLDLSAAMDVGQAAAHALSAALELYFNPAQAAIAAAQAIFARPAGSFAGAELAAYFAQGATVFVVQEVFERLVQALFRAVAAERPPGLAEKAQAALVVEQENGFAELFDQFPIACLAVLERGLCAALIAEVDIDAVQLRLVVQIDQHLVAGIHVYRAAIASLQGNLACRNRFAAAHPALNIGDDFAAHWRGHDQLLQMAAHRFTGAIAV